MCITLRVLLFSKVMRIKMLHYSAADRNKDPILKALTPYVKKGTFVLEIASGTGQHVTHFAQHLTDCRFQPTECDASLINSIKTYVENYKLTNIDEPKYLDVLTEPNSWFDGKLHPTSVDYFININMIHISPVECTEGLFRGCGHYLKENGFLFLYGPFAYDGIISPTSNVNFNVSLRSQNAAWGLRDVQRQLVPCALKYGLKWDAKINLPNNNELLVWKKFENFVSK